APEDCEAGATPAPGPADEQELRVRPCRNLLAQVRLDPVGEAASANGLVTPEAAVFDEQPVVDPARGRGERLGMLDRDLGAGRPGGLSPTPRHPAPGRPTPARA